MIEVVSAVLFRDNKILVQERAKNQNYAGYWEFPGGKVNENESIEDALIRELYEEIGITPNSIIPSKDYNYIFYDGIDIHITFFIIQEFEGAVISKEGQQIGWFSLNEALKLKLFEPDKWVLESIISNS